jgi:hypothetical protein
VRSGAGVGTSAAGDAEQPASSRGTSAAAAKVPYRPARIAIETRSLGKLTEARGRVAGGSGSEATGPRW